jgi:hypothetical protein
LLTVLTPFLLSSDPFPPFLAARLGPGRAMASADQGAWLEILGAAFTDFEPLGLPREATDPVVRRTCHACPCRRSPIRDECHATPPLRM